ncbi:MAG TPA: ATP-binding protein [Usitatibacteraceae bacterium]|nr:ATP-binding protein [Usitatibacteraceae bacterium]
MRIRTQAYLSALISVAIVGVIVATLLAFETQTQLAIARLEFANRIYSEGVSGLRLATTEYFLYRQPRARQQWLQRHASLTRLLASDILEGSPEQASLEALQARNRYVGEVFAHLAALYERPATGATTQEYERRLVTQIMLATQDMVVDAALLATRNHERLVAARRAASSLILALVLLAGVIVLVNSAMTLSQLVRPILLLKQGAEVLAGGGLAFRTNIAVDNEIGELARSFDRMAAQLAESHDALERKGAQLEEANRELEAFSYSVSHDLRAPLRGIDGWSLALLEDFGDGLHEKARGYLGIVRSETQRMGQLIDDLLMLSRVGRAGIRHEPLDLSAIATSVAARLEQAEPARRFEFAIQQGMRANGDEQLLRIALANLFDNACKFTRPRAVARIEFGAEEEQDPATGARRAVYFVRDNGVGFDMARAKNLFGAFQRLHTTSEFPGTGIGLATVKRIIHRHGGTISAEAQVGRGATFRFTLEEAA